MIKHYNITIFGRVQGVSFRWAASKIAIGLNISGFIKNQYDGSVFIEAEGEIDELSEFIKWCKRGPDRAFIEEVQIEEGKTVGFRSFEIRR